MRRDFSQLMIAFLQSQIAITLRTSKSVEWGWIIGRVVLVLVLFAGTFVFLSGTGADMIVYGAGSAVLVYNIGLAMLLRRGHVRETFLVGFALDNVATFVGWWCVVWIQAGAIQTNDMYLMLFPKLIIGVARLGWFFGSIYTIAWIAWVWGVSVYYYHPDGYDVTQLPLRVVFLAGTAALTARTVVNLNRERHRSELLREETEAIAEIGRLAGSTLDFSLVFGRFVEHTGRLVPFDRLALARVDEEQGTIRITHVSSAPLPGWEPGTEHRLNEFLAAAILRKREAVSLDEETCTDLISRLPNALGSTLGEIRALVIAPVVSADKVVAILVARSASAGAFTPHHSDVLNRIGAHIGGALANAQLYESTLQLATERKRRDQLDSENRELHRVSEAKSSLLSAVSHELRTPLTSIIAYNDILLKNRSGSIGSREISHLKVMRRNGDRLAGLINDLLDVSRIEGGKLNLQMAPFDVCEMIRDIERTFDPILASRRQTLTVDLNDNDEPGLVVGDKDRLVQVITNLVSNGSKYSPDGSEIELLAKVDGDALQIVVRDHGYGISEVNLRKLFTAFFRAEDKATRAQPGTGLGLVIAKGIIEAHGGKIDVQSEPGQGTAVSFNVRLKPSAAGESEVSRRAV